MQRTPLAIIILAAGMGTRMKSERHKVLHPIAGKPMIMHLIDSANALNPDKRIVITGARREQVEQALSDYKVTLATQAEQLGTAHAVLQAQEALAGFEGDVLILYGDVPLVTASTMQKMVDRLHFDDNPAAVVLGFRPDDCLSYGRIISDQSGLIDYMVEYKDASLEDRQVNLCNSGLMAVHSADLFQLLSKVGNDNASGEYYLPDIVMLARDAGRVSAVIETDADEVAGINSRAELSAAEMRWQNKTRQAMMDNGVTLIAPETVWFSHDTQIGQDVTIAPNVVFGEKVCIEDNVTIHAFSHIEGAHIETGAQIGPYARLRPGSSVGKQARVGNFVELKASRLGDGAKANHLSYIGDSDIGAKANVGAGTITCNYDGFLKYRTSIGERAFIGSNSSLVAPVHIGDDAIIGAGSVITSDVEAGALAVARGKQYIKAGWATRFREAMRSRKGKK